MHRSIHLAFALFAAGCAANDAEPRGPDAGSRAREDDEEEAPPSSCDEAPARAKAVFETYCAACHGGGEADRGGFDVVVDAEGLVASGRVVASDPEASLVYRRISAGEMPPAGREPRPSSEDVATVRNWIRCGAESFNDVDAAAPYVGVDELLDVLEADIRATRQADRERIRYLSLVHLSNAGVSDLDAYREALAIVVNSLSFNQRVIAPKAIDDHDLVYRIDLRDYVWDADTWDTLVEAYPYSVIYDEDSPQYPFAEDRAERLREETGSDVPYVHADWLVTHATQAPLYYRVLELGTTLDEVASSLGIDVQADVDDGVAIRAGFNESGVSNNNRIIERHPLPGDQGAFWLSHDFGSSVGTRNIFSSPLDFTQDGGEMIFNLPNGLQAYFITNATGLLLDKAPQQVVRDATRPDSAVAAGLSCMGCHHDQGIIPKQDEVREHARRTLTGEERDAVLDLYPEQSEIDAFIDEDGARFVTAREAATETTGAVTPITRMALDHESVVDLRRAAAHLGLTTADLEEELEVGSPLLPAEAATLRSPGGTIARETFDAIFADLVCAIGLGEPCRFSRELASTPAPLGGAIRSGALVARCGCAVSSAASGPDDAP